MQETLVTYVNEHLAIGNWGKFSVYLALAAAFFSATSYILSFKLPENAGFWRTMGRLGFWVHSVAVIAIFTILFVIIQRHYFEYQYAWQHSSKALPLKYMVSCFWEGQEGSFLLWLVWHVVIGNILIFTARSWESPVMAVMGLAQLMLVTMLLGIELLGYKIGSSPFDLLRDKVPGPIFSRPDYLNFIEDGNGLNPLLQNYWMVIHPPTLFFGFAATIVPFAYAMAALWTKRYTDWVKPAIPWALVGVMILGAGIIMGGYWAYESLTFGGYWAWDPVENAALIPWLILIAAVHIMLIYKSTGNALYSSYIFTIIAFLLVLYATFLTRSGILGNTSVHSFTDLGMSGQLLMFLFFFFWLPAYVTIRNPKLRLGFLGLTIAIFIIGAIFGANKWVFAPLALITAFFFFRNIYVVNPIKGKEEAFSSREFWMFIGSLVFIISGLQVIGTTSIPVFNKLFNSQIAQPEDVIGHYNKWQLPIAIIIAILTGISQYFKYKKTSVNVYVKELLITAFTAVALTVVCIFWFQVTHPLYVLLLMASLYAVVGNAWYIIKVLKGKVKIAGASVAHIGFGILLVGVLVSSANKNVISVNTSGQDLSENLGEKGNSEHTLIWKNRPARMANYEVTYLGDSIVPPDNFFKMRYREINPDGSYTGKEFYLYPNSQKNPKMGLVSNPDTRHYPSHDVFTYVSQVPDKEGNRTIPYDKVYTDSIRVHDTIYTNNGRVVFDGLSLAETPENNAEVMVGANMRILGLNDTFNVVPRFILENGLPVSPEEIIDEAGLKIRFTAIVPDSVNRENSLFGFEISERKPLFDYVVLKAVVFPYINFVWAGTVIMVIGFLMAIVRRVQEYKRERLKQADV